MRKIHAEMKTKFQSLPVKLCLVAGITLLLLIPLAMVKNQIRDRQDALDDCVREVSGSWGLPQTLTGPSIRLAYRSLEKDKDNNPQIKTFFIYPKELNIEIQAGTQILHRSIYDVLVYKSEVVMTGYFLIPDTYATWDIIEKKLTLGVSDLRGIEGDACFSIGTENGSFQETSVLASATARQEGAALMVTPLDLPVEQMDGKTAIPFKITYQIRGSSDLMVRPYGETTHVRMQADCPNPSFTGDFLPAAREIGENGFTASWEVSKINRGEPDSCSFGVKMLQDVTQYQQSMRSAKYGILVILLIFLAALGAELLTGRPINLIQYAVVGLSIVLFYTLVLSFSEFMTFGLSYLLSALMTVTALTCYFRAILRNRAAYVLGGLSAAAFVTSFVLLQMETYAFLCGTLLLFVLLSAVMYFTRNLASTGQSSEA